MKPPFLSAAGLLFPALLVPVAAAVPAEPHLEPVPRPAAREVEPAVLGELAAARSTVEDPESWNEMKPGDRALAYGRLGGLYAAYELWDAARACFHNAAVLEPSSFAWLYQLGVAQTRRGAPEEAAAAFERALRADPRSAVAWLRLGETRLALGDDPAARSAFSEALASPGHAAAAHFGLGRLDARAGDLAAAVEHFLEVLALEPEASQVRPLLAQAYRRLGRLQEARQHLARGGGGRVSFEDPLVEAWSRRGSGGALHHQLGDRAAAAGRFRRALAAYRRAVAADPEHFYYRRSLGLTLFQLGDAEGALAELESALDRSAGVPDAQRDHAVAELVYNLAGIELHRGREARALARYRQVLRHQPDHAGAHLFVGNLLLRSGHVEEALDHLERAAALDPRDPRARQLLERARGADRR